MKSFVFTVGCLMFCAGCSTAGKTNGSTAEPASVAAKSDAVQPSATSEKPAVRLQENADDKKQSSIVGTWRNRSCESRKYIREIEFFEDGKFSAADKVSPCPPGAACVWSGIILWKGIWKLQGRAIEIDIEPIEMGHRPQTLPAGYVVLSEDPLSIGEKIETLVCPYQKVK